MTEPFFLTEPFLPLKKFVIFFYDIGILYVYEECVCNAHGGWNRALELELQVVANHFVDAGNQTRVGPLYCLSHLSNLLALWRTYC